MNATIILVTQQASNSSGYVIGALIAMFILGYLLYSLIKPEKF